MICGKPTGRPARFKTCSPACEYEAKSRSGRRTQAMLRVKRASARPPEPQVPGHNSGQYIEVAYADGTTAAIRSDNGRPQTWTNERGWFVKRTCPCHRDQRVTQLYRTREQAERAWQVMVEVSMQLDTDPVLDEDLPKASVGESS